MALTLSEAAVKQVKELQQARSARHRVPENGLKGGGCSGLSYSLSSTAEMGPHDKDSRSTASSLVDKKLLVPERYDPRLRAAGSDGRLHVRQTPEVELWMRHVVLA